MSEINSFSDYTNKYNSNIDYSALFGGTSNSSSLGSTNILSDEELEVLVGRQESKSKVNIMIKPDDAKAVVATLNINSVENE